MGIVSKLISLPVRGPLDGVWWIAAKINEQVDSERNSPATLRAALAAAETALLSGEISENEYDLIEDDILERLSQVGRE